MWCLLPSSQLAVRCTALAVAARWLRSDRSPGVSRVSQSAFCRLCLRPPLPFSLHGAGPVGGGSGGAFAHRHLVDGRCRRCVSRLAADAPGARRPRGGSRVDVAELGRCPRVATHRAVWVARGRALGDCLYVFCRVGERVFAEGGRCERRWGARPRCGGKRDDITLFICCRVLFVWRGRWWHEERGRAAAASSPTAPDCHPPFGWHPLLTHPPPPPPVPRLAASTVLKPHPPRPPPSPLPSQPRQTRWAAASPAGAPPPRPPRHVRQRPQRRPPAPCRPRWWRAGRLPPRPALRGGPRRRGPPPLRRWQSTRRGRRRPFWRADRVASAAGGEGGEGLKTGRRWGGRGGGEG